MKITIIDDNANSDPFYPELTTRLRQDLLPEPTVSFLDATHITPFDPKRIVAELSELAPDVIIMDFVLHEQDDRQDCILSDWLTREIKRDPSLRTTALIYVSNFFGDHNPIPAQWRRWCFAKHALVSDEPSWALFRMTLENPSQASAEQAQVRTLQSAISADLPL